MRAEQRAIVHFSLSAEGWVVMDPRGARENSTENMYLSNLFKESERARFEGLQRGVSSILISFAHLVAI